MSEIRSKVRRYIALNTLLLPLLDILAFVSSILVVRFLGVERYATVVILTGFTSSLTLFMNLGFPSTVTKLWVEFDNPNIRNGLISLCILMQLIIALIVFGMLVIYPELPKRFLGSDFMNALPPWGIICIIISIILSVIFNALLNAELNNKVTIGSSLFKQILWSSWLICASLIKSSTLIMITGLLLIQFISSILLVIGSMEHISIKVFFKLKFVLNRWFLRKFIPYFFTATVVVLFRYVVSLPFIVLILNKNNMINELVVFAIIMKIIDVVNNAISIPINKITTVLFATSFKNKDKKLFDSTYNFVQKYQIIAYMFAFSFLLYFVNGFIVDVYGIEVNKYYFAMFFFVAMFSTIIGVSNNITQIYEHYSITICSSILSYIATLFIYSTFIKPYGIYAVFFANVINYSLFSGVSQIFIHKRYPDLKFPWKMLLVFSVSLMFSAILTHFIANYIVASVIGLLSFSCIVFMFYKPDKQDREILREVLPHRVSNTVFRLLDLKFGKWTA